MNFDRFEDLIQRFEEAKIPTYTELIIGLPGETLNGYKQNWETLAGIYPPTSIYTWNCNVLVNAPMNEYQYKKEHNIKTFRSYMFMQHTIKVHEVIKEYEDMVRETRTLPLGEINILYMYNWVMLVFHSFGILDLIATYFKRIFNITFNEFYEDLIECLESYSGLFSEEYQIAHNHTDRGYKGEGWDHYDSNLGDICWPIEEASWLRLASSKLLKKEIIKIVNHLVNLHNLHDDTLVDLCDFQLFMINSPNNPDIMRHSFIYDWKEFFVSKSLNKKYVTYERTPIVQNKNLVSWMYETMWFGRREQKYRAHLKQLNVP